MLGGVVLVIKKDQKGSFENVRRVRRKLKIIVGKSEVIRAVSQRER